MILIWNNTKRKSTEEIKILRNSSHKSSMYVLVWYRFSFKYECKRKEWCDKRYKEWEENWKSFNLLIDDKYFSSWPNPNHKCRCNVKKTFLFLNSLPFAKFFFSFVKETAIQIGAAKERASKLPFFVLHSLPANNKLYTMSNMKRHKR